MNCLKKNEGIEDRIIRGIIALVAFLVAFFMVDGALSITLYFVFALFAMTAITGYCGVYGLFGISTCHNNTTAGVSAPVLKEEKSINEVIKESKPSVIKKKVAPKKPLKKAKKK